MKFHALLAVGLGLCATAASAQSISSSLEAFSPAGKLISEQVSPEKVTLEQRTLPGTIIGQTLTDRPFITPMAKDYSLSITIPLCADDNEFPLAITVGNDIKTVKYLCYEGNYSGVTSNLEFVAEYGDEIDSDDYGEFTIKLTTERNSRHTLFVTGLDSSGNYRAGVTAYFYSINDNDDQWTTIGNTTFTDDMLASIYSSIYVASSTVPIQENKKTPGYYRVVNPYGRSYPYFYKNTNSHSHNHYIYIHAEDPSAVYIEESPICTNLGHGGISIASLAIPGWSDTANPAAMAGTFDKSTHRITFPQKSLVVAMQNYNNGTWYRANANGRTCFTIPYSAVNQTISWNQTFGTVYIGDVITLEATASSGLPVTYTLAEESRGMATIEGNRLTTLAGGTITVIASQPGDGDEWLAAENVTRQISCAAYHADDLFVCGTFNNWAINPDYMLTSDDGSLYTVTLPGNILTADGEPMEWRIQTADGSVHFGLGDVVEEGGSRIICGGGNNISNISGKPTIMLFLDESSWADGALVDMTILVTESVEGIIPPTLYVMGDIAESPWSLTEMAPLEKDGHVFAGIVKLDGPMFIFCEKPAESADAWQTLGTFFGPDPAYANTQLDAPKAFVAGNSEMPFTLEAGHLTFPMDVLFTVDFDDMTFTAQYQAPPRVEQTITWETEIAGKVFAGDVLTLEATASSYLPVTYSLATGSRTLASLEDDDQLTILQPGEVTVIATQDGNAHYLPAQATFHFTVDDFLMPERLYIVGFMEGHNYDVDNPIELEREGHVFTTTVTFTGRNFFFCEHPAETPGNTYTVGRTFCAVKERTPMKFGDECTIAPDTYTYLFMIDDSLEMPMEAHTRVDFDNMKLSLIHPDDVTGVDSLSSDCDVEAETATYFNLQGIAVGSDPTQLAPGLYVRRSASSTKKVVVK